LNLLDEVMKQLAAEYADTGRAALFEILRGAIGKRGRQVSYADLAARTGTSEGAVQQAVQRLRKRYKAILRERIAATLDDPDEAAIDDEIRDLFTALAD
jgi:biotin operon repressor